MSAPRELFRFCPRCGKPLAAPKPGNSIECGACGLVYFLNPAVAVGVIITDEQGRALFLRRAKDPRKGMLALPGGFVDAGETAEAALCREAREEVGAELTALQYLCSHPNAYEYRGITYPVLDLFYTARLASRAARVDAAEVESFCWLTPREILLDEIAFPSIRAAVESWTNRQ